MLKSLLKDAKSSCLYYYYYQCTIIISVLLLPVYYYYQCIIIISVLLLSVYYYCFLENFQNTTQETFTSNFLRFRSVRFRILRKNGVKCLLTFSMVLYNKHVVRSQCFIIYIHWHTSYTIVTLNITILHSCNWLYFCQSFDIFCV